MSTNEEWRAIEGYEGLYEVSNLGRVRSLDRTIDDRRYKGRILKGCESLDGYLKIGLHKDGTIKTTKVHRLVALAFVPNPDSKETVNHINENKHDNRACNLEWLTIQENLAHGTVAERRRAGNREHNSVPVYKIAQNGYAVLERYDSIVAAAEAVGAKPGQIWNAAKCGGRFMGFYWRRTDSITKQDLLFWESTGERVSGENIHENVF